MRSLLPKLFVVVTLVLTWLEPAIALAQGDGGGDGSGYTLPAVITAMLGASTVAGVKIAKVYHEFRKLLDGGKITLSSEDYQALEAKLAAAEQKNKTLEATAVIKAELDEVRRAKDQSDQNAAGLLAELNATKDRLKGLESLVHFDRRLTGEVPEEEADDEPVE